MVTTTVKSVGWIGLGKMGMPICRRLAEAGLAVSVLARNAESRDRIIAAGHKPLADAAELAGSDVIISAVPDDVALSGVVSPALVSALGANHVYIDISTVSPTVSASIAERLAARGTAYLRAPVSGSTTHASAGQLTVLASGPRDAFNRMIPLFAVFSARQFHLGEAEQARYLKLAINSVLAANSALIAEALAIGEAGGLQRADMLEVMTQSAIATPLLGYKKDMLIRGDYPAAFSVSQIIKDLDLVMGAARADHVPVPVNAIVRQRFEQAYAEGQSEADFFCLAGQPRT